jgi:hypothetical protein
MSFKPNFVVNRLDITAPPPPRPPCAARLASRPVRASETIKWRQAVVISFQGEASHCIDFAGASEVSGGPCGEPFFGRNRWSDIPEYHLDLLKANRLPRGRDHPAQLVLRRDLCHSHNLTISHLHTLNLSLSPTLTLNLSHSHNPFQDSGVGEQGLCAKTSGVPRS